MSAGAGSGLRRRPARPVGTLRAALCAASSAVGALAGQRSRTTLGILLLLVLAAGGQEAAAGRGAVPLAGAAAVERSAVQAPQRRDRVPVEPVGRRGAPMAPPAPRARPRWQDPCAGGRPPVRAPAALAATRLAM